MILNPADVRQLIRFATMRTGNAVVDEDLTQEVCMRALDAFRRAGHVRYPKAFLTKIVSDTVRDHWRRRRPTENLESLDERFTCFTPSLEIEIDHRRQMSLLRDSLKRLEAPRRRVIELFYLQGMPVREIAVRENRSLSAVKMDLLRGRQKLAQMMTISKKAKHPE